MYQDTDGREGRIGDLRKAKGEGHGAKGTGRRERDTGTGIRYSVFSIGNSAYRVPHTAYRIPVYLSDHLYESRWMFFTALPEGSMNS